MAIANAGRNKTIKTSISEGREFLNRCISVDSKQNGLSSLIDKTICGDIFAVSGFLPSESVDLLIVDPPYNMTKSFNGSTFSKKKDSDYEAYTKRWISSLYPLLKPNGSIYVCCDWESSLIIGRTLEEFFHVRNRITWQREKGRGAKANWK
ncbi:MAG: DNA methyltransferase, partial [Oscillospiraceae bacterium]|nr:DNA methyltransferase [Oscillospiraceae bacterium]